MKARHNGRPSQVKGRILEEALRLFATKGFEGTSVQAVAEVVGIKNPSLLYYFPSKDQLLDAVVDDMLEHWKAELPRHISESVLSRDRFTPLVEAVVAFFAKDQNQTRFFIREALDRPKEIGARIRYHLGPWMLLLSDYINAGKRKGSIKPTVDAEYYIFQVILMAAGTVALSGGMSEMLGAERQSSVSMTEGIINTARDILLVDPNNAGPGRRAQRRRRRKVQQAGAL
ncbi:MAG: TetR/AcrR family transcriptional regulator [Myxococcota bacterium]|nr:TetR/AcrR family transcriptional regulator [Myxococcota bacterium]